MGKFGWGEVDKPTSGDKRFLSVADGETKTIRLLDTEPYTIRVHSISQEVNGEEVFRSIQATEAPDDDYVDANTNRYPAKPRHAIRCVEYDEDGEPDSIKILIGGVSIFRALKKLYEQYEDITDFDIDISRDGEKRDTDWTVSASPRSADIDVAEWVSEIEDNEEWAWENIFPEINAEDQKKIIDEAGIDITYDPVVEMMEELDMDEALAHRLTFGKYGPDKCPPKGKTLGEVWRIDQGWVMWAAENVVGQHDETAAACRYLVENTEALEGPKSKKKLKSGDKKSKKEKKAREPEEDDDEEVEEEDVEVTRKDWKKQGNSGTPEKYLARWFGKGGNEDKINLAIDILESEGLGWDENSKSTFSLEDEEEDEDDYEEEEANEEDDEEDEEDEDDDEEEEEEDEDEEEYEEVDDVDDMEDADLRAEILEIFADFYTEPREIIKVVKKMGKGKSKIKDLTTKQLRDLLTYLRDEHYE